MRSKPCLPPHPHPKPCLAPPRPPPAMEGFLMAAVIGLQTRSDVANLSIIRFPVYQSPATNRHLIHAYANKRTQYPESSLAGSVECQSE